MKRDRNAADVNWPTSVRSVANHFTMTSYTCKQPNVNFFLVDGGGANETGQQTNSARHPSISDIRLPRNLLRYGVPSFITPSVPSVTVP